MNQQIDFHHSSGNVFADLGFDNADEMLLKAQLTHQITIAIESQNLTQTEAASVLGIDEIVVSDLVDGQLSNFSVEQLFRFLNSLGHDVEISIKPKNNLSSLGSTSLV